MTTVTLKCRQCLLNSVNISYRQLAANRKAAFSINFTNFGVTNPTDESLIKKAKQRLKTKKPTTKSTKQKVSIKLINLY